MYKKYTPFIYTNLPVKVRNKLCTILDHTNKWEELAVSHMKLDPAAIHHLRDKKFSGKSATDELLRIWGQKANATEELFLFLRLMENWQAMEILKPYVIPEIAKYAENSSESSEDESEEESGAVNINKTSAKKQNEKCINV